MIPVGVRGRADKLLEIMQIYSSESLIVIDMNSYPIECGVCNALGFHRHCVPWYCEPVLEGHSEGGYRTVCKPCHDKWAAWSEQQIAVA